MTFGAPQNWGPGQQQPGQQAPPPGYYSPMSGMPMQGMPGPGGGARFRGAVKGLTITAGVLLVLAIADFALVRGVTIWVLLPLVIAVGFGIAALVKYTFQATAAQPLPPAGYGPPVYGPPQQPAGYPQQPAGYPQPPAGYQPPQQGYSQPPAGPPFG
jgi:hypothetical protein